MGLPSSIFRILIWHFQHHITGVQRFIWILVNSSKTLNSILLSNPSSQRSNLTTVPNFFTKFKTSFFHLRLWTSWIASGILERAFNATRRQRRHTPHVPTIYGHLSKLWVTPPSRNFRPQFYNRDSFKERNNVNTNLSINWFHTKLMNVEISLKA